MFATSYEGFYDDEELETVPLINQNKNNCYVVNNSESDDEVEVNLFNKDFDTEVEATPKTTTNAKEGHAATSFV